MSQSLSHHGDSSFRIAMTSPSHSYAKTEASTTRKLKRRSLGPDIDWSDHMRDWLNFSGRGSIKRWIMVIVLAALIVLIIKTGAIDLNWFNGEKTIQEFSLLVPKVDRAAFDKLKLVENYQGLDDENLELYLVDQRKISKTSVEKKEKVLDVLPTVKSIPDYIKPNPAYPNHQHVIRRAAVELDAETCPDQDGGCSFLVASWIGEQETKAQLHLYQLGLLAVSLNRTLVLPNVAKSRFGTCNASPFAFYYSSDSLAAFGIPTITHEEFINWSVIRDPYPSGQVVSITGAKAIYPTGSIEIDSASDPYVISGKASRNLCLRSPRSRINFSNYSPLTMYPPVNWHRSSSSRQDFGGIVVNTLSSPEVRSQSSREKFIPETIPTVLAVNYELRFPILSPAMVADFAPDAEVTLPFQYFPYDSRWLNIAEEITLRMSPFIAIHWRTETLTPVNLVPCATALIDKLIALQQENPEIKTVYLATDYPIEDLQGIQSGEIPKVSIPHSGTFAKVVTESHHKAFKLFLQDFKKRAKGLKLTTFSKEYLLNSNPSSLIELDPGLIGIVDKSVALKADIFLAAFSGPGKGICGKSSSFTAQIIDGRELDEDGKPAQVYHWSLNTKK